MNSKTIQETIRKNLADFREEELEEAVLLIEADRYKTIGEVMADIDEMLDVTREQLLDRLDLLYSKFSEDPEFFRLMNVPLNTSSKNSFRRDMEDYLNRFENMGVSPDTDLEERITATDPTILDFFLSEAIAEMEILYAEIEEELTDMFKQVTEDSVNREAFAIFSAIGIGLLLSDINYEDILNRTWRPTGSPWDEVLWYNKRIAINDIRKAIITNAPLENGKELTADRLDKILNRLSGSTKRIAISDSTHFALEGHRDLMDEIGIGESVFTAVMDDPTCDICRGLDGLVVPNDQIVEGENAPPIHDNCRCVLIPLLSSDEELSIDRKKAYEMEEGISYDEWLENN